MVQVAIHLVFVGLQLSGAVQVLQVGAVRLVVEYLDGMVQVDDAYLGGERSDGSTGCATMPASVVAR